MAFGAIRIVPGVNTQKTPVLNEAGVVDGQYIRWRDGLPEKIGGWVQYFAALIGSIPRCLWGWEDLNGNSRLAIGSTASLKVALNGTLQDITPQATVTNTAPNFSTIATSPTVTIIDSGITGVTTNNTIFLETPVSIGGLVLFGPYPIATDISTDSYTITAAASATSTVNNAGAVPSFATTSGSASVTVTLANHGLTAGTQWGVLVPTTVGGITISGRYQVQAPITTNTFTIVAANTASSNASGSENGGNALTVYFVTLGPGAPYAGYGTGNYGAGGYGTGVAPASSPGTPISSTDWSIVNFGEVLIANSAGGAIYYWGPESGNQNAQVLATAPFIADGIFLAQPEQILVAWGVSDSTGIQNPLRIVWSDAGNFLNFTATSTDFAGGFTIPIGSKIVSCQQVPNQFLVWTDTSVWSGQYVGQPNVFNIIKIMDGCGLIGRKAAGTLGETTYWMGQSQFFMMAAGGAPQPLPCSVRDFIFQNLDMNNVSKIRFFSISGFNEVGWFFPSSSGGSGENDSYVKFNVVENEWDKGPMGRSAWLDYSILGAPLGATTGGVIYQHETSPDAAGAPINASLTTGTFRLADGEDFQLVDYMVPDFIFGKKGQPQTATLLVTLIGEAFPSDGPNGQQVTQGPYTVTQAVPFIEPRLRSRDFQLVIQSQDVGSFWRGGLIRYRRMADGRNP
jgi:hypothetical protein